ncbi:MAG: chorismate mutase [Candidatus Marinimicrobia bacterium]|nr:chorismate mutase [Candidatus Neomarinimicrobiota bacterium]
MDARLTVLRNKIDQIDNKLVELILQRLAISHQLGMLKQELSLPIDDPVREQAILNKLTSQAKKVEDRQALESIYSSIFRASKQQQCK